MPSHRTPILLTLGIALTVVLLVRPWQSPVASANGETDPRLSPLPVAQSGVSRTPSDIPDDEPPTPVDPVDRGGAAVSGDDPPRGEFMYLFDVSTSTHPGGEHDPFANAAEILTPAIDAVRSLEAVLPQRHRVGTIGSASLMQRPLCDFRVEAGGIFTVDADSTVLPRRIAACAETLAHAPPEKATDIRGALQYAALSLRGERRVVRGVVLVSDLEEFIPKGRVAATPNLQGICVVALSMMTPSFAARPDSLTALEQSWAAQLRRWGAKDVRVSSVLGFDPTELATFFRRCRD